MAVIRHGCHGDYEVESFFIHPSPLFLNSLFLKIFNLTQSCISSVKREAEGEGRGERKIPT